MNDNAVARTVLIAAAIVIGGWLVARGLVQFRVGDRTVSVKGVAERVVKADVALWPLRLVAADNDLGAAQRRIQADRRTVTQFLTRYGIDSSRVELQGISATDTRANPYGPERPAATRYVVNMTLMVRTSDIDRLALAAQNVGELLAAGVVFSSGEYGASGPTYLFTRLNDLKPEMLAEANANAMKAAQEFARSSRSSVGEIRRANQGVFEILARDPAPGVQQESQVQKTLRVVTSVEYGLR
jgi:uncharacterized protein